MKKLLTLFAILFCAASARAQLKLYIAPTTVSFTNTTVGDSVDRGMTIQVSSSWGKDVNCTFTLPKTPEFRLLGPASFTVKSGTTDTLFFRFKPDGVTTFHDTVYLTHNGDTSFYKSPVRIRMIGTGVAADTFPKITVSAMSLAFGPDTIGQVSTKTFSVKNTSSDASKILTGSIGSPSSSNYSITSGGGAFSLHPGDSVTVAVKFTAPAFGGTFLDTIAITSNANPSLAQASVTLSAIVHGPDTIAQVTISPQFANFGSVLLFKTKMMNVYIINSTNIPLTLTGTATIPHAGTGAYYSIVSGGGAFSLAKGDTQTVVVAFTPLKVASNVLDSMIITTNSDPSHQRIREVLFGQVVAPDTLPRIGIGGIGNFGGYRMNFASSPIGIPITHSFTITNTTDGKQNTLSGTISTPKLPQFVVTPSNTFLLDSGKTATVNVTFTPTTTAPLTDTITLNSNDSTNAAVKIILTGSGRIDTLPKITIAPTTIDFGTVTAGSTMLMKTFTVTNTSDSAKTLNFQMTYPAVPFHLTSSSVTSSFSLAKGASLNDTVTFNPVISGTYNDSIVVTSNSDASTARLVIHIVGVVAKSGVRESNSVERIMLVPNPSATSTTLRFSLVQAEEVRAALYDSRGTALKTFEQKIYDQGENELALDVANLPNGVYYLRLELADGVKAVTLVVAK
ncbi:MAG TPA: choice-of-anchor D domain-containing protein [Candidatus Kapabacteria bacterium]|nr:choice-of-anchor D domain-containing protein [Candidatus Kapabacteria bacterium]